MEYPLLDETLIAVRDRFGSDANIGFVPGEGAATTWRVHVGSGATRQVVLEAATLLRLLIQVRSDEAR